MLDYATLKLVWWVLIAALLVGFAVMDGHDMGVGALLPFVARDDTERRVTVNTVGPHWDGNQVWLITAGGAIFAAWPMAYAAAFSGFYFAMMAVLAALVLRPAGFDFRSKVPDPRWRRAWDGALFVSGAVPPLVFGVAFGNLLLGVPFRIDGSFQSTYSGSFFGLFSPFALLAGVTSLAMIVFHGANYLVLKTEGAVRERARTASLAAGAAAVLSFAAAGVWIATAIPGHIVLGGALPGGVPDPLRKTVGVVAGGWLHNFHDHPALWLLPIAAIASALAAMVAVRARRGGLAFLGSATFIAAILATVGASMFPFVMPSSIEPRSGLTLWDCTSSRLTLTWMFWAVVALLPPVLFYTAWAYRVMRGKVTAAFIRENETSTY